MAAEREQGDSGADDRKAAPESPPEPASGPPAATDVSGGVPYADAEHHAGTWALKVALGLAVALAVGAYLRSRH